MAITVDTWNRLSFRPFSHASWTGLSDFPYLPASFVEVIVQGGTVQGYVLADGDPFTIIIEGGQATLPAAVVDSESTQSGTLVESATGEETSWSRDADGTTLTYGLSSGVVTRYDAANTTAINTVTS